MNTYLPVCRKIISPEQKLIRTAQARERDQKAQELLLLETELLMERAALHLENRIWASGKKNIVFFIGPGNNGADALACARGLKARSLEPRLVLLASSNSELWQKQYKRIQRQNMFVYGLGEDLALEAQSEASKTQAIPDLEGLLKQAELVVDALYGAGFHPPWTSIGLKLIHFLMSYKKSQKERAEFWAFDVPSGVYEGRKRQEPVFEADLTLCLDRYKEALFQNANRFACGSIELLNIGLDFDDQSAFSLQGFSNPPDFLKYQAEDHKYRRGSAYILSGSVEYPGAAVLNLRACLRSACGMVYSYHPEALRAIIQSSEATVICHNLKDFISQAKKKGLKPGALLAGSGWTAEEALLVPELLNLQVPLLLDAGAFDSFSKLFPLAREKSASKEPRLIALKSFELLEKRSDPLVLTPHMGELSRLLQIDVEELEAWTLEYCAQAAQLWKVWIILKGPLLYVASPWGEVQVFDEAHPVLATAGSGDIFAGLLCGICAQAQARLVYENPEEKTLAFHACLLFGISVWLEASRQRESSHGPGDAQVILPYISSVLKEYIY